MREATKDLRLLLDNYTNLGLLFSIVHYILNIDKINTEKVCRQYTNFSKRLNKVNKMNIYIEKNEKKMQKN